MICTVSADKDEGKKSCACRKHKECSEKNTICAYLSPRRSWDDNIKMDVTEIEYVLVDWMRPAHDRNM
jgi:hypothetical protein